MKLKKNYNLSDLSLLFADGAVIERDYSTDTFGTSGLGYMERQGIKINGIKYQVVYTSRGYGRITRDLVFYNGRYLKKHIKYMNDVNKHFNTHIMPYIRPWWLRDKSLTV